MLFNFIPLPFMFIYLAFSAANWSVADVCSWLQSLGLSQYVEVFKSNEISGGILLEVGEEDLDYMSITALGHRKVSISRPPIHVLRLYRTPFFQRPS